MRVLDLAIIDNRSDQVEALAGLVEEVAPRCGVRFDVKGFCGAEAFRAAFDPACPPDVVLLDIELDERTSGAGIGLALELNIAAPGTQIVYVTGYIEYCTSVYRTNHAYFLTKPVRRDDLCDALAKAVDAVSRHRAGVLTVSVRGNQTAVPTASVSHIESMCRQAKIHVAGGELVVYAKLSELLERLPVTFVQCHKSFVVNLDHVVRVSAEEVVLKSGGTVPVSRRRSKDVREAWKLYLLGTL